MQYVSKNSQTEMTKSYATGFTFLNIGFFTIGFSYINTEFISSVNILGLAVFLIGFLIVALTNSSMDMLCYKKFEESYIKDKNKNKMYKILISLNLVLPIIYSFIFISIGVENNKFLFLGIFLYLICLPKYLVYKREENRYVNYFLKGIKKDTLQKEVK